MKNSNSKYFLNLVIKLVIFIGLFWQIYAQVFHHKNFEEVKNEFITNWQFTSFHIYLSVVLVLMIVNWGLETIKWKRLIDKIEWLSFSEAYQAILCGVAFSLFTPNRIGEYGGRIFYLHHRNKLKGALLTLVGSISQIVVVIILGTFAFNVYMMLFKHWGNFIEWTIGFVSVAMCLFVLSAYFNMGIVRYWLQWLNPLIKKFPWMKKAETAFNNFADYSFSDLFFLLLVSLIRYGIFTFQYWLLLRMFGVDISLLTGLVLIILIFFVQTIVPTFAIAELGIRGAIALSFLTDFSNNYIGIISASSSLWFINLIIPSLIGGLLVFRINFLSDKQ